jgi:hypothetical protein
MTNGPRPRDLRKSVRLLIFIGAMLLVTSVSRANDPLSQAAHTKAYWQKRVARVHQGIKRERVEKLLPQHSPDKMTAVPHGHASTYAVDLEWSVTVPYDFHGFIADERKNPHLLMHLYENRVIGPVKLIHRHTDINRQEFPAERSQ